MFTNYTETFTKQKGDNLKEKNNFQNISNYLYSHDNINTLFRVETVEWILMN